MKKILLVFFYIFPTFLNAQTGSNSCAIGLNNGFEIPLIKENSISFINASNIPNWSTTAPDNIIEIWSTGFLGVPSFEGNQFAELNANYESTLIKSFVAQGGVGQILKFAHRGRQGVDVMSVEVGPKGGPFLNLGTFSDGNTSWGNYSIPYTPQINGPFELRFISVSSAGGDPTIGNFLDGVDPGFLPIVSNIASPSIIKCNNILLDGSASLTGSNIVYLWTTFNGNIVSASNSNTVTISSPGTYTLTVKDTVLICSNSSSVIVNSAPSTVPDFTALAAICSGSGVPVLPATSTNGISGTWSPATVSNTTSGTYTFTPGAGQCATTATLTQTVNPNITPGFTALAAICSGGTAPILTTTSNNGVSGTWSPATVSNTSSGTYIFTPSAGQCAVGIMALNQIIHPLPKAFAGNNETKLALTPFQLHATGGISYIWTQGSEYLDNPRSSDPVGTLTTKQLFTVMVRDSNNCLSSNHVLINIYHKSIINIPNSFTPNGDGLNDIFHIIYPEINIIEYFNILNRWGQLIFSTNELMKGWDGNYKGVKQPNGNYIWILKGKKEDNKDIFLKGSILLIR